ncbi:MAG: hypothetical protein HYX74_07175, partial [Acidobacteria bacterium]|nr:hypothetical protein [Acidobacteriota bacterium]
MKRVLLVLLLSLACSGLWGQAPPQIDVTHYDLTIEVDPPNYTLRGSASVQLQLSESVPFIPFEINNRLNVSDAHDQAGRPLVIRFDENNSNRLLVGAEGPFAAGSHRLEIRYEGSVERESYAFLDGSRMADGYVDEGAAYLGYNYRWFPVHAPLFDPATARIAVTVPLGFTAVVAGTPGPVQTLGVAETFEWELAQPVSQFALVIGKLREYRFASEKPPLHIFLDEGSDSLAEKLSQQIFSALAFFQENLVPYPFEHLTVVGIPNDVRDEMAGPGVVYLPLNLLNDSLPSDVELARRLALQWWGLGIIPATAQDMMLADGFAYYQAARYLESRNQQAYKDEILRLAVLALKYESRASIS